MALTDSLISYWKLDEASGSRADSHGTNTLTDNNTVTSATGKLNNAASFAAASSEYLSIASNSTLQTGDIDFTLSAWINLTTKAGDRTFVAKYNESGNSREYCIRFGNSDNRLQLLVSSAGTGGTVVIHSANTLGAPSTATWYFIVAWHDSVANTLNIQVNNGTVDSVAHSAGVYSGTAPFHIGARSGSITDFHNGLVDEVGFWKRVLTSDERTTLYGGGTPPAYSTFAAIPMIPRRMAGGLNQLTGGLCV